jgi:hypothetical protein
VQDRALTIKRIHVCGGGIRGLLLADIARRAEQLTGQRCRVTWSFDEPAAAAWNIYPPDEISADHPAAALFVNCPHAPDSLQVAEISDDGWLDPLAARLATLQSAPGERVESAAAAEQTLRHWRAAVAEWARFPGAPLSRSHVASAVAAFGEFDTPRGIEVLRSVESDNQIAPGSKFETFAYLDRVVGVDLARDLGR